MNSHLTHQMAHHHQQDLHRQAERVRAARAASGEGRLSSLYRRVLRTRSSRTQPQVQAPAAHPVAGVASRV